MDRWHGLEKIQMCFLTETYRSRSLFPPASIVQSCGNFIMQRGRERSPRKENSQVYPLTSPSKSPLPSLVSFQPFSGSCMS
jgi:hypothetical protein